MPPFFMKRGEMSFDSQRPVHFASWCVDHESSVCEVLEWFVSGGVASILECWLDVACGRSRNDSDIAGEAGVEDDGSGWRRSTHVRVALQ